MVFDEFAFWQVRNVERHETASKETQPLVTDTSAPIETGTISLKPANLAAGLYHNTDKAVKLIAVNTIDLTKTWDELKNGSMLITEVLVVRREFVEQYPDQLAAFLSEYKLSTEYVNSNIPEAAQLIEKFDIFKAAVAKKAIPFCNIIYLEGSEMKTALEGYLQVIFDQKPESVGGVLPEDDFYYVRLWSDSYYGHS